MNVLFIIAQSFGVLALSAYVVSTQQKERKRILRWNSIYSIFSSLQYLFLGAISGCATGLLQIYRNFVFQKYKKRIPKSQVVIVCVMALALGIIFYDGPVSFLPVIHTIVYTLFISENDMTHFRFMQAFSSILMFAYNIYVKAYVGIVIVTIQFISSVVSIIRLDSERVKKILH